MSTLTYSLEVGKIRRSAWEQYWRWVWLLAFFGSLVFVVRDISDIHASYLQLEVIHRPIIAGLVAMAILPGLLRRPHILFRGILALLTLFGLWRLMSTLWSIEPLWTLYRSLEYLAMVGLTAYTALSLRDLTDLRKWMNWVWVWFGGISLISVWVGAVILPEKAFISYPEAVLPFQLGGVFPIINPNGVGELGALLAIVSVSRWLGGKDKKWLLLAAIAIVTMILAQGRSAFIGFLVGLLMVLILYRRPGLISGLGVLALAIIMLSELDRMIISYFMRGQSLELFATLSGRTFFWKFAWDSYISENPWLGYGAFAGARFGVLAEVGRGTMSTIHNTWIESALELGIPGMAFFALIVITLWIMLLKRVRRSSGEERQIMIELIGVAAVLTVRSLFTTDMILHSSFSFFLIVGGSTYLAHLAKAGVQRSGYKGAYAGPYRA